MGIFSHSREWIYTRAIKGTFQKVHRLSGVLLIGMMFLIPWIKIGDHPALLFDVGARRFFVFGQVYTASDGFLLVLGMLIAAFTLFLVSALFGRLWCGYFCPQTVFLEEWVRRVELLVEGDGNQRRRRDAGPWTFDKIWRKSAKVLILIALSFVLGMMVMGYFAPVRDLWMGRATGTMYGFVGVVMATALADWLWFREQLCIYVCPYARFQSALTDDHSITVAYNPSVPISRGKKAVEAGHCIDCKKCVTVCPMGIDIRDGFQLECIACARCVDACEDVMSKFNRPTLVEYTTIAAMENREKKIVRPRVVIYSALVTGLMLAVVAIMGMHNPMEVSVQRSPGSLYQLGDDGWVRNTYMLKLVNNASGEPREFEIQLDGIPVAQMDVPDLTLASESSRTVPLVVRVPKALTKASMPLKVTITGGEQVVEVHTTFLGPGE